MAITGAAVSVGSSILGGVMGSNAYSKANSAAQGYYNQALNFEKGVYSDATSNLSPWITGGQEALGSLEGLMGLASSGGATGSGASGAQAAYQGFTQTPYYTFPLAQATQTMNQQAASKGLSLSGGQLASLGKYASNYAGQQFGNWISALNNLSNTGESASNQLGQIGSQISSQVSNTSNQQAGSAAGSIMGSASAWNQAMQGIGNTLNSAFSGSSYGGSNSNNGGVLNMNNSPLWNSLFGGSSSGSSYVSPYTNSGDVSGQGLSGYSSYSLTPNRT